MAEKNREDLLTENENLRQQIETQNGLIDELQKLVEQKATVAVPPPTGGRQFTEDGKVYVVRMSTQSNGIKYTPEQIAADIALRQKLIKMKSPVIKELK
ncbi:MAG: hypothetical protein ACEQSL_05095 [Sediminibacterium sp.]